MHTQRMHGRHLQRPGGQRQVQAVHGAHDEDVEDVPAIGRLGGDDAVLGQRDHGAVVEDGHDDDEDGGEVPAVGGCVCMCVCVCARAHVLLCV